MAVRILRLAVFDLDYTIWQPEMYQLRGAPALKKHSKALSNEVLREARTNSLGHVLVDREGEVVRVFDGASHALMEINRLRKEGHDISAAVASRTDEPKWAGICMRHLLLEDETTLIECFEDRIEIDHYSDKTHHLRRLHEQTGIPYDQMCFFDNEYWNIQCVQKLGVHCVYTPDGMTRKAWRDALSFFGMSDW